MRVLGAGVSLASCAVMLAACGSPPDDASEADFCEAYEEVFAESGLDFAEGKKVFEDLVDVGTPDGIPDEAREGFEILVDIVDEASDEDEGLNALEDLDAEAEEKLGAFVIYATELCDSADDGGGGRSVE